MGHLKVLLILGEGKLLFILITKRKAGKSNEALHMRAALQSKLIAWNRSMYLATKHNMMKNEKDVLNLSALNKLARKIEVSI